MAKKTQIAIRRKAAELISVEPGLFVFDEDFKKKTPELSGEFSTEVKVPRAWIGSAKLWLQLQPDDTIWKVTIPDPKGMFKVKTQYGVAIKVAKQGTRHGTVVCKSMSRKKAVFLGLSEFYLVFSVPAD
jgi:hypothetical protein